MELTIYTKGNLHLVLCLDDPAGMHSKVEKPVSGPNSYFCGYCTLHLPNPKSVLNIMCNMYRYRYDVELHILYFPKNVFFYGALSPGVHVHTPF